jgi:excisionase family DNA binding protein
LKKELAMLTVREAAARLGLRDSTLRAWIMQRRIGIVRLGRAIRIPLEEVERLIAEGTIPARMTRNGR